LLAGKEFCKAACRIKNANPSRRIGWGGKRAVGDFAQTSIFACCNSRVALLALADERLGRPAIGAIAACYSVA
jgi:hypothetical protein